MRYYGSAMRTPHVQGAFRQRDRGRGQPGHSSWPTTLSDGEGAMAEPLSVALHAVNRAGPLLGKSVLVTGCGPIGALVVIAARRAGATHIVVTDMAAQPLRSGAEGRRRPGHQRRGAARARWRAFAADKGQFDVLFEASGNERALRGAFDALRPRGIIVQVGLGGEMTLPINTIVAKEFDLRGTFRFHEEFARGGGAAQQAAGRREAADLGDPALPRRRPRLRAGGRSLAGDEGVVGFRLSRCCGLRQEFTKMKPCWEPATGRLRSEVSASPNRPVATDAFWPNAVDGYSEIFPHIARMRRARSSKRYEPASATRPEITPVTMASAKGMS